MPKAFKSSAPPRNQPKVNAEYVANESAPPMLRWEESLPRLPVPELSSTAAKYLETVEPHLTREQFAKTQAAVKAFVESEGRVLQERLRGLAANANVKNWLADWWNETAYMGYRDPVVVFVSYYYLHVDDKTRPSQAKRAAQLLKSMLPFRQLVERKELEVEIVRGSPLTMSSYEWLFHACRYPVKPSDTAKKFDATKHNHVVFVRKNKFYKVALADASGRELSAPELEAQIEKVIELAGNEKAVPVGALTSENRDIWTDARAALLAASPSNAATLEEIESAMMIVCLDDTKPVTREEASWQCWVGDGRNRFFDKHQLIVFENGKSGFLGEHSCMDGTPTLRMNEFVLGSLAHGKVDLGSPRDKSALSSLPPPQELTFTLDARTRTYISEAESHFDALVARHDMEVLHYDAYGKEAIKAFKASPDAWAQMVKQLAFHKMFGRPGVCYESAQTRKFHSGRTEVIRSASKESKAWAEAMLDPKQTDQQRAALFRKAIARHLQYAAWAGEGQGVDRHLFGLKKCLKEGEPLPQIYQDEAYAKTSHWELSTSQLSSPYLDGWGYGEVVPDGYGLSYSIGDEYIRWTITSLKRRTAEFKRCLEEAATETHEMMKRAAAAEEQKKAKL
ncbi:acyltransferase ChoActase/COT/CPT [Trametes cingulata]|nr:acyltransferase ChoActase/COT/CPT [Trametes cingulata]